MNSEGIKTCLLEAQRSLGEGGSRWLKNQAADASGRMCLSQAIFSSARRLEGTLNGERSLSYRAHQALLPAMFDRKDWLAVRHASQFNDPEVLTMIFNDDRSTTWEDVDFVLRSTITRL